MPNATSFIRIRIGICFEAYFKWYKCANTYPNPWVVKYTEIIQDMIVLLFFKLTITLNRFNLSRNRIRIRYTRTPDSGSASGELDTGFLPPGRYQHHFTRVNFYKDKKRCRDITIFVLKNRVKYTVYIYYIFYV